MTPLPPVPGDAPAVERGIGFFETLLLVGRRAVFWEPHAARLLGTLAHFELPVPTRGELERAAEKAADAAGVNDRTERALRVSWIAVGADLESAASWRLDVSVRAIPESTLSRQKGARAVTLPPELQRDTPGAKSTSYFAAILGLRQARRSGGDEGLFLGPDGTYLEGTSTSLVAWSAGAQKVALRNALPSVTSAAFLDGKSTPAPLRAEDLRAGSLLLGSLTKGAPIVALDGTPCEVPGAMLWRIREFNERLVSDPAWSREI